MAPTSHVSEGERCQVAHLEQCGHERWHVLSPSTQHGMLTDMPGHHYMSSKSVCVQGLWCGVATPSSSLGCILMVGGSWAIVARGGGGWQWWWCSRVVAMTVVIEKERLCCLLIMCLWCGKCPQTSGDLPVGKSEVYPYPHSRLGVYVGSDIAYPDPYPPNPYPCTHRGFQTFSDH